MQRRALNPNLPEAANLGLVDLLLPRGAVSGPAVEAGTRSHAIPVALGDRWARRAEQQGWLADTLFAAAWVLLQARWLGRSDIVFHEVTEHGAQAGLSLCCSTELSPAAWLALIDQARRVPGSAGAATPAEAAPFAAWIRTGLALPAQAPASDGSALRITLEAALPQRLIADAASLDAEAVDSLLGAIADTAQDLLERSDATLGEIRTLPAVESETQLQRWNNAPSVYDAALTVPALFERQVRERGESPAWIDATGTLDYRQLDERSGLLARQLQARGVRPGHKVGLLLDRSGMALVALLGILKAGAAYVPVQPDFPAERIGFMLVDAEAVLVLTQAAHRPLVPAGLPLLSLDEPVEEPTPLAPLADPASDGDTVAYVMYTSGSTGVPKGIEICHHSILRLVIEPNFVELRPGQAVLHAAPLGFDASTLEIWGPLLNGGVCVVHDEQWPTGAGLARTIARHSVDTAWLTAALFNAVVDDDPDQLAGLSQLLTGGEALSVPHVRRALAALPGVTLINGYGPTECTTFAATHRIPLTLPAEARSVPIGRPINDTRLRVLSPTMALLPTGLVGELCIGGRGLARGYLRRPELTAERFVPDPFGAAGERLYRTGDQVRWLADGSIEYIGRIDGQLKIRGHRVEIGEIEQALLDQPEIRSAAVVARPDASGEPRLVAYLVARGEELPWSSLRERLSERLPEAMLPAAQVWLAQLPVTTNGKLDRRALPEPARQRPELAQAFEVARGPVERSICAAFARALEIDQVGRNDNFFELGGNSLLVLRVLKALQQGGAKPLSTNAFFRLPTPAGLAEALGGAPAAAPHAVRPVRVQAPDAMEPVALVGMAGRFPGAADVPQFWDNLVAGRESITFFDDASLDAGVSAALRADPAYVRARGVLEGIEQFDAAFFGINPKEAELMDPQQRVFLEICWECLERAGYVPDQAPGPVGVYGGMYNASYFQRHVSTRPDLIEMVGEFQVMLANEKDYITTRVANKLNLTGPAVSVHTACSTSLVAIAQAFHALRTGQCRMALAGGASINCPPRSGYLYNEGSMLSPDGRTRSFDANARGTVFSDGAAVVLLKRLSDAIADGDTIHAVLRGVAVNNDGGAKASFTAPSADGQAAVIEAALASAGVDARSISYVETHGTATPMGDPIEIEGLARAYATHTDEQGFCAIGSLKSNVGHMVTAAGAAGLIKVALALQSELIPASLHYETPNPAIDFERSPFRVNDKLLPWPRGFEPRRAGVSSFGVGGTNAHVIVEEAPLRAPADSATGAQLLQLSARSPAALARMTERLAEHLEAQPDLALADVAHTLRVGRKQFAQRACVVADTIEAAVAALRTPDSPARSTAAAPAWLPQAVFMFPGQGAQYAGMGRALRDNDAIFRVAFDECLDAFGDGALDFDLRERMDSNEAAALTPTSVTQPATFVLEYALARRLMALGAHPAALIGHSVGEFAAAVLAGVMRLEDAARLVARRGALMQALPPGTMLSVRLPAAELLPLLPAGVSLAADNAPAASVAAGPAETIEVLRAELERRGIVARPLQTSHAFHSAMMDQAVAPFEALLRQTRLSAPQLPIYSTLTGRLLEDAEATEPSYWARHLRETVQFSPALHRLLHAFDHPLFIELGPRSTLSTLVRQHATKARPVAAAALLADQTSAEVAAWRLGLGRLWTQGVELDLAQLDTRTHKHRLELPTYPFDRKRFWVDIAPAAAAVAAATPGAALAAAPVAALAAPVPLLQSLPELTMTAAVATAAPPARRASLVARLRELFEDLSGVDMADVEGGSPFVEIGLDSLTLTQAALQVKKHFKVNLTFRQLMESYRSFDALAEFLDSALPADPQPAAPAAPVPIVSAAAPVGAGPTLQPVAAMPAFAAPLAVADGSGGLVQHVIAQQMQLMQQQLALLAGVPNAGASSPVPAAVAAMPASAAIPAGAATAPAAPAEEVVVTPKYDVKKAFGAIARIHTQSKEPTERQKARLAAFMRRYIERTQKSKDFTSSNRSHMADPRVVNGFRPATKEITYQIVVERSKGSRLWDIDGNEYVDTLNGFGMNLFGWTPDFINEAVRQQLDQGYEIGPQHPLAADVTRLLCDLTGFDRAGLCNTGSEAVMAALRIARTVTGRSTVVLFTGSYHGTFDEVLVRAGRGAKGMSAAPGVLQGMFGDVRVLDYGTPEALEFIRANADDLAAVLTEPVQSRRPDFQPREFLREVRAITEKSGTCLIFDEVITGFRCDLGGAQAMFGIRADLATYGKVLGGGFPVGVIAGKRAYMDALDGGPWQYGDDSVPTVGVTYFAGTFVRHPLALAASKAALEYLKRDDNKLQTQLNLHTAAMADELSAFCREVGAPVEIRYFSSLWRVSWLEDHPLQDLLFAMMRSRGVHILDNFPCFMTTAHSQQDIATIKSAFKESVAEMQEAELLPRRAVARPTFDATHPPAPNARLGRDKDGQPAWFVPDPNAPGKFKRIES